MRLETTASFQASERHLAASLEHHIEASLAAKSAHLAKLFLNTPFPTNMTISGRLTLAVIMAVCLLPWVIIWSVVLAKAALPTQNAGEVGHIMENRRETTWNVLAMLLLGLGIFFSVYAAFTFGHNASGDGLLYLVPTLASSSFLGAVATRVALARKERYKPLSFIALALNRSVCLIPLAVIVRFLNR